MKINFYPKDSQRERIKEKNTFILREYIFANLFQSKIVTYLILCEGHGTRFSLQVQSSGWMLMQLKTQIEAAQLSGHSSNFVRVSS